MFWAFWFGLIGYVLLVWFVVLLGFSHLCEFGSLVLCCFMLLVAAAIGFGWLLLGVLVDLLAEFLVLLEVFGFSQLVSGFSRVSFYFGFGSGGAFGLFLLLFGWLVGEVGWPFYIMVVLSISFMILQFSSSSLGDSGQQAG